MLLNGKSVRLVQLPKKLIIAGKPLSVPIYSGDKKLLAEKSTVLTQEQAATMVKIPGLFTVSKELVNATHNLRSNKDGSLHYRMPTLFERVDKMAKDLNEVYVDYNKSSTLDTLQALVNRLQHLYKEAPNLLLAKIHLDEPFPLTAHHAIHVASLCEFAATALHWDVDQRRSVVGAALSMNLTLGVTCERANLPAGNVAGDTSWEALAQSHPIASASALRIMALKDNDWIDYITMHHERIDGKGFPSALKGTQIPLGASLLYLADLYAGKARGFGYEQPMPAHFLEKNILMARYYGVNRQLADLFISRLGTYPPGTIVQLRNSEMGVVIEPPTDYTNCPQVRCFIDPRGKQYPTGVMRPTHKKEFNITTVLKSEKFIQTLGLQYMWGSAR